MNLPNNPLKSFQARNPHLYGGVARTDAGRQCDSSPLMDGRSANAAPGIIQRERNAWLERNVGAPGLRIVICGQVRGGKNNAGRKKSGGSYAKPLFKKWRDEAVRSVHEQLPRGWVSIHQPVNVRVTYVSGDRRRRDCPAILDAVWHILERAGVVADDTLLWPVESSRSYDKDSPRCEIEFL